MTARGKRPVGLLIAVTALLVPIALASSPQQPEPETATLNATPAQAPDQETVERWLRELSNWGRWGKDDQRGTLNLITESKRREAAKLVRDGVTVSLAHETMTVEADDNHNPYGHELVMHGGGKGSWAVDRVSVLFHGYAHSHLDALCHMFHEDKMYNGFSRSEVDAQGCRKLSIESAKEGIFTRGVLIDIPKLKGLPWLEPGTAIYAEDFEAWERHAGVRVESGDVLLVRTGRWARRAAKGPWDVSRISAGLHASSVRWLKERDVAMIGTDVAGDVFPSGVEGLTHPVHLQILVGLGMSIFDNLDLEALSREAEQRRRYAFLFTAAPLPLAGGTGSPLNPIAVF
jgi:kynurenine formamidase